MTSNNNFITKEDKVANTAGDLPIYDLAYLNKANLKPDVLVELATKHESVAELIVRTNHLRKSISELGEKYLFDIYAAHPNNLRLADKISRSVNIDPEEAEPLNNERSHSFFNLTHLKNADAENNESIEVIQDLFFAIPSECGSSRSPASNVATGRASDSDAVDPFTSDSEKSGEATSIGSQNFTCSPQQAWKNFEKLEDLIERQPKFLKLVNEGLMYKLLLLAIEPVLNDENDFLSTRERTFLQLERVFKVIGFFNKHQPTILKESTQIHRILQINNVETRDFPHEEKFLELISSTMLNPNHFEDWYKLLQRNSTLSSIIFADSINADNRRHVDADAQSVTLADFIFHPLYMRQNTDKPFEFLRQQQWLQGEDFIRLWPYLTRIKTSKKKFNNFLYSTFTKDNKTVAQLIWEAVEELIKSNTVSDFKNSDREFFQSIFNIMHDPAFAAFKLAIAGEKIVTAYDDAAITPLEDSNENEEKDIIYPAQFDEYLSTNENRRFFRNISPTQARPKEQCLLTQAQNSLDDKVENINWKPMRRFFKFLRQYDAVQDILMANQNDEAKVVIDQAICATITRDPGLWYYAENPGGWIRNAWRWLVSVFSNYYADTINAERKTLIQQSPFFKAKLENKTIADIFSEAPIHYLMKFLTDDDNRRTLLSAVAFSATPMQIVSLRRRLLHFQVIFDKDSLLKILTSDETVSYQWEEFIGLSNRTAAIDLSREIETRLDNGEDLREFIALYRKQLPDEKGLLLLEPTVIIKLIALGYIQFSPDINLSETVCNDIGRALINDCTEELVGEFLSSPEKSNAYAGCVLKKMNFELCEPIIRTQDKLMVAKLFELAERVNPKHPKIESLEPLNHSQAKPASPERAIESVYINPDTAISLERKSQLHDNSQLRAKNDILQEKNKELQQALKKKEEALQEATSNYNRKKTEFLFLEDALKTDKRHLEEAVTSKKDKIVSLGQEAEKAKQESDEKLSELKSQIASLNKELVSSKQKIDEVISKRDSLITTLTLKLETSERDSKVSIAELEAQIKALTQKLEATNQTSDETNKHYVAQIEDYSEKLRTLRLARNEDRNNFEFEKSALTQKLAKSKQISDDEINRLNKRIQNLTKAMRDEKERSAERCQKLKTKNDSLLDTLLVSKQDSSRDYAELEKKRNESARQVETLERKLREITKQLDIAQSSNQSLNQEAANKIERLEKELEKTTTERDTATSAKESLISTQKNLQQRISELCAELQEERKSKLLAKENQRAASTTSEYSDSPSTSTSTSSAAIDYSSSGSPSASSSGTSSTSSTPGDGYKPSSSVLAYLDSPAPQSSTLSLQRISEAVKSTSSSPSTSSGDSTIQVVNSDSEALSPYTPATVTSTGTTDLTRGLSVYNNNIFSDDKKTPTPKTTQTRAASLPVTPDAGDSPENLRNFKGTILFPDDTPSTQTKKINLAKTPNSYLASVPCPDDSDSELVTPNSYLANAPSPGSM